MEVDKNTSNRPIRVRMAPSPTGPLHIGTARTTLFNLLFARHMGGTFILRVEDTDKERSKKEYEDDLIDGLHWLGIEWDEGPEKGGGEKGDFGPYRDTERITIHKKYVRKFLEEGTAYQCYCTKEELEAQRQESESRKVPYRYPGTCRNLKTPPPGKTPQVVRLRMPDETISFDDMIRGKISVSASALDDFAIARTSGEPLYNFAVAIDDYEMKISHVIRGEDHISNTPKQIAVFRALGATPPIYGHLPLILNPDRSKMSKRYADTALAEYRANGYLPEALANFLALLGWHPTDDQEIFALDELIAKFDIARVQKAGAVFDQAKLDWLNREYIKRIDIGELTELVMPFLESAGIPASKDLALKVVQAEQGRAATLKDIAEQGKFFFVLPEYGADLLVWKNMERAAVAPILTMISAEVSQLASSDFTKERLSAALEKISVGRKKGEVFWPLRVALSGLVASPDPVEIMTTIGKDETMRRIDIALKKISS
jgi:glutamyl-tRNA synthetase